MTPTPLPRSMALVAFSRILDTRQPTGMSDCLGRRGVFVHYREVARRCASRGTDPSPVPLRLAKAPERDTLSPRERAVPPLYSFPESRILTPET
jgi:hypothetical protein